VPEIRVLSDDYKVPVRDAARPFEMLNPAQTIRKRIVHGMVFFSPID
jgi:hypothetical protein